MEHDELIGQLQALYVWPQSTADNWPDVIGPRHIAGLYSVGNVAEKAIAALTTAQAQADAQEQRIAALEAENAALREVDRLAEIASQWHWWNAAKCNEYEDKDDLFQDIDFARAKARAALGEQQ